MKKKLFLLLIATLAFTACKKDKTDNVEADIIGKWNEKTLYYEYYNSAGTKVFSETGQGDGTWEFTATTATNTPTSSTPLSSEYRIGNVNGKKIIFFARSSMTSDVEMEIISLTKNSMTWSGSVTDVEYYNGGVKTAAKSTLTVTFAR
jgi:hypothetical protein